MEINPQTNRPVVSPKPEAPSQRPNPIVKSEPQAPQTSGLNSNVSEAAQNLSTNQLNRPVNSITSEQEALNATLKFRESASNEPTLTQEAQSSRVTSDMVASLVGE